MNKVASIIVTHNRIELLKECVDSLRNQTYRDHSIIVVNNGSTDSTEEWLKEQVDLIVINQGNVGGAGGFFTGIKYACENSFEFSWVMDDDAIPFPTALERLYESSIDIKGFLCSDVIDLDGKPCNVPKVSLRKSNKTNEPLWGEYLSQNMIGVDITSFVSVFFRNSIVDEVGLPYKEYFIWGDDTEYTSRISYLYPSYMVMDSIVLHKRKIQAALSIFTEKDKNRMKMYFYLYRNSIHGQRTFHRKFLMFSYSSFQCLRLLFIGKYKQSYIVAKAILASLAFNPKIVYPTHNA